MSIQIFNRNIDLSTNNKHISAHEIVVGDGLTLDNIRRTTWPTDSHTLSTTIIDVVSSEFNLDYASIFETLSGIIDDKIISPYTLQTKISAHEAPTTIAWTHRRVNATDDEDPSAGENGDIFLIYE
jgi:hypothetical protein